MPAVSARRAPAALPVVGAVPTGLALLLVAGVWLIARPYLGVRHDGVLYLGQVLQQLSPGLLERDIFFAYGSQERFTLFPSLMAQLQGWLGLAGAQLLMLLFGHLMLLAAAWALMRPLHDVRERWLGLVSLAVMSHYYGGLGLLSFAETFVTARTLAEPLALAAVAALCARRHLLALACLAAALLAHPLMALPAAAVMGCLLVQRDRRWAWGVLAAPAAFLPAALGIAPFDALLGRFDGPWLDLVRAHNTMVFMLQWTAVDAMVLAFDVAVLVAAARLLEPALAALARAALGACAVMLAVSLVGADGLHNPLITALQLWRIHWIVHLLALLVLPALLWRQWSHRPIDRIVTLACALLACAINGRWEASWALALACAGALAWRRFGPEPEPRAARLALGALVLALGALSAALLARTAYDLQARQVSLDTPLLLWALVTLPCLGFGMVAAVWWASSRQRLRPVALLATACVFAWGAHAWDRRSEWTRHIEHAQPGMHPFSRHVPAGAQVWWPSDRAPAATELAATWAVLGRPSYFSIDQGGGIVFGRQMALEFGRRKQLLTPLLVQRELCQIQGVIEERADPQSRCVPEQALLDELCAQPHAPDFMVLPFAAPRGLVDSWSFTSGGRTRTHHLHACRTRS